MALVVERSRLRGALRSRRRLFKDKCDWYAECAEQRQVAKVVNVGPELRLVIQAALCK
jgi:hypothetical protein